MRIRDRFRAMATIAFIGTGVMGRSMAGHLQAAGHTLHVHNRTRAKAQPLLDAGARWHDSAGAAAAEADFVITIVGFPQDVETTYLAPTGIIARAKTGAVLIDMTTSSPELARRIATEAATRGLTALDAPVTGGDIGAREARLSIMVGGDAAAFEKARPLFERMGKIVIHQGGPGAGQLCKLANQIAIASVMMSWCEALAFAQGAGLDPTKVLGNIGGGAAGSTGMNVLAPRALQGDFAPGFYVKHFLKDLRLALECAEAMKLDLPGTKLAKQLYDRVAARGWDEAGTQVLWRLYAERT